MSSSAPASRYMSSRSKGVTNVRLSRSTTSCVKRSPSCSSSLMSRARSSRESGKLSSSSISACAMATVLAAARLKRSKNSRFCGTRLRRATGPVVYHGFAVRRRRYRGVQMGLDSPAFQAYRGTEPPRFASPAELECAKVLDYYGVPWLYEPRTFVLETDAAGRVTEAFTPDFYLPEQDLYIELTVMKQSLVTRKNRKLRKLRARYPEVRIKLFYKRDIERLAQRFRLDLAS